MSGGAWRRLQHGRLRPLRTGLGCLWAVYQCLQPNAAQPVGVLTLQVKRRPVQLDSMALQPFGVLTLLSSSRRLEAHFPF